MMKELPGTAATPQKRDTHFVILKSDSNHPVTDSREFFERNEALLDILRSSEPGSFEYNGMLCSVIQDGKIRYGFIIDNYRQLLEAQTPSLMRHYESILDLLPDGIMLVDKDGIIRYVNPASQRFNDVTKEYFLGRKVSELQELGYFHPAASLLALKSKKIESVIQKLRSNKKLMVHAYPIFNEAQTVSEVLVVSSDVTQQMNLEQQLEEKDNIIQYYSTQLQNMSFPANLKAPGNIEPVSKAMKNVEFLVNKAISSDINVLLLGESGVGKTMIARRIHEESNRYALPFIVVNCSAIPENLIEAELFGYEAGSFTGALDKGKIGLFEAVKGGTIFLDEIGEMPIFTQIKLLQVLQDREIRRIGSNRTIPVSFRLISATNQDLMEQIHSKSFREDLYYRLCGLPISVPPLRERTEDIPALALYFLDIHNAKSGDKKKLSHEVISAFKEYAWPGNIRELEHTVTRMCVLSEFDIITTKELPEVFKSLRIHSNYATSLGDHLSLKEILDYVEADIIRKAYGELQNSYKVAENLGLSQTAAWRKIKKYCFNEATGLNESLLNENTSRQ